MMKAARPARPNPSAVQTSRRSTRKSSYRRATIAAAALSHYNRPPASILPRSADLAGRPVGLSIDVPAAFDAPLALHHRMIGRWLVEREHLPQRCTRDVARQRIERAFGAAVTDILGPFDLADLRVVTLIGEDNLSPALVLVCDTIGQIDLGWIEKSNVLSDTLFGNVAPVGWRAAAYGALVQYLRGALPYFGYDDLFEEVSAYYWDGETDDEGARKALTKWHGHDPNDLDEMTLPSQMAAKRPEWMTAKAAPLKDMPAALRTAIARLRDADAALRASQSVASAWRHDRDEVLAYLPEYEERSPIPPLTLVPADQFARELDDVGRFGMEQGFDDVIGLCPLTELATIDAWLASLRLGAEVLLAAQDLINLDPANPVKS